jgi:hypothetical protein
MDHGGWLILGLIFKYLMWFTTTEEIVALVELMLQFNYLILIM